MFFGWGLLLAVFSVWVAPAVKRRLGVAGALSLAFGLFAGDLLVMALLVDVKAVLVAGLVLAGAFIGVVNTVLTEAVMVVAPVERPVASAAYSFVRFGGGAIAPWLAGRLDEDVSTPAPLYLGATAVALAIVALVATRRTVAAAAYEREGELVLRRVLTART